MIEQLIATDGSPDLPVQYGSRTWIVPKHYIALHGIKGAGLPQLKFPEVLTAENTIFLHYLYDDGGATIPLTAPDYRDQIFSHVDPDNGRTRHFHIPKLRSSIKQTPVTLESFECLPEQARFVQTNHCIDEAHLERLSAESDYLDQPGIICVFPDQTQLIVDGNHRYIKRTRLGKATMEFWMVPERMWRRSLLRLPSAYDDVDMIP